MKNKDTLFSQKSPINCNGLLLELSEPKVMGILNVTPDSFYDGGRYLNKENTLERAKQLLDEGANILDVGGYSSRPGAEHITREEELNRIRPVLDLLRKNFPEAVLSVDTFRSEVAEIAVNDYRVDIINDISAGELDENMFDTIARLNVPYIMMHMKGVPQNMQSKARYDDIMKEIMDHFSSRYDRLRRLGVRDVIIDPGFGFGKTIQHNFYLLNHLEQFRIFELPLMVGLSRKSMIFKTLENSADEALNGTTVLHTLALMKGADILRVHDVKEAREVIALTERMKSSSLD